MTIPQENGLTAKKVENARRKGPMIFSYPKGVYFCLLNEFSERFSFYGFCTILMLYLKSRYDMSKSTATLAFHAFICLSYFSSIFGSIWADGFVGPYKVVVFTSVVYLLGPSLVTLSAMPIDGIDDYTMKIVGIVGLLITAWSSGARKPCATAFPANQFPNHMVEERNQMFAMFYLLTYTSALLSQLVTSHLRSGMQCMGQKTCYPMAWGSTALFTVVALVVLACGHRFFQKSPPASENVIWKALKCMRQALAEKMRGGGAAKNDPNAHWLDSAYPTYDKKFINDVKSALKVMLVMTPTISFWTLFFQTGSTFVVQGSLMKGRVFNLSIPPDQIILVSSIFVMVLICVLDSCVYPCMRRLHISHSPLRRVAVSMIWGIAGFVLAAIIQLKLADEPLPNVGYSKYTFYNLAKCRVSLEYDSSVDLAFDQNSPESLIMPNNEKFKSHAYMYTNCDTVNGTDSFKDLHHTVDDTVMDNHVGKFVVFWEDSHNVINYNLHKTEGGESKLYILFHPDLLQNNGSDVSVKITNPDTEPLIYTKDSGYLDLKPPLVGSNIFNLTVALCNDTLNCREIPLTTYESQNGAVDVILITNELKTINLTLIQPNSVNLLWQIPQYCLLVSGDMLISVSGVEFAYNQASPSMKSVLQAFRLITICAGQIIDMAISGSGIIHDMATEFVFWTIFATAGLLWFFYLAARYQYVDFGDADKDENDEKPAITDGRQAENGGADSWSSTKL